MEEKKVDYFEKMIQLFIYQNKHVNRSMTYLLCRQAGGVDYLKLSKEV